MLSTVLTEVKGLVDRRFLLTAFFPMVLFAGGIDFLLASSGGGLDDQFVWWESASGTTQILLALVVLAAILVAATALSSSAILIAQLYEGYYWPKSISAWGVERQEARKSKTLGNRELRFPHARLLPTALGNVLRAAEEYPELAYGIRTIVVWPRLFLILPPTLLTSASGPADTIQFLLNISLLATAFGFVGGAFSAAAGLGPVTYLCVTVGSLALARLAYRGAVETAIDYGLHIRGAFDLHRNDLLEHLGRSAPTTRDEERRLWQDVSGRLQTGEPKPVRYLRPESK